MSLSEDRVEYVPIKRHETIASGEHDDSIIIITCPR